MWKANQPNGITYGGRHGATESDHERSYFLDEPGHIDGSGTRCLRLLDEGPLTSSAFAHRIGSDPRATDRLLNSLVALDFLEKREDLFSRQQGALPPEHLSNTSS